MCGMWILIIILNIIFVIGNKNTNSLLNLLVNSKKNENFSYSFQDKIL